MNLKTGYLVTVWVLLSSQISISQPTFALNGSTIVVSEHCYRLTSHKATNDVGSLWSEIPVDLNNAVEIRFAVNMGCSKYAGEGMAFVMHTNEKALDVLGCGGAGMGFGKNGNCEGLSPSLAIEIDSKFNRSHKDIYQPHLALVKDGNLSQPLFEPVRAKEYGKDVRDCEYHDVKITWMPSKQELNVYFDDELRITYAADVITDIFEGASEVYFGFTGSTGNKANMQMICVQSVLIEVDEILERKRDFEDGVGIYPNPIKEKLTIDIDLEEEEYVQMQLYDSTGKLIYEIPTHVVKENEYYFNLPGLPSGVYYVTVTNGTHRVSKKIVHISTIRA
ncbi:MAG: T9SS type A sorting domain-containing protein [Aureispira sp.]|nr:T9SS type A sorting domain-containing protein [Aureispira sp.]